MDLKGAKHEWRYDPAEPHLAAEIARAVDVSAVLARVLVARGVRSADEARAFLAADVRSLPDPHLLPDASRVLDRLEIALRHEETVAVHGHDDADGVCAAAIMVEALGQLGSSAISYIPDRRTEGHGLNRVELDGLAASGVDLIITVDSCVSDTDEIAYGNSLGIDTIVTDHHEIPPSLPPACAIVNAKLPGSEYPYRYLAGVGVAFRLAELMIGELARDFAGSHTESWHGPRWLEEAIALAAIGSIADKVPTTGDNRTIVARGLAAVARTDRPGLRAILEESRLWGREVGPDDVRESVGPIFGRVSDGHGANDALDMLLCPDLDEARAKARLLVGARLRWRESAVAAWRRVRGSVGARAGASDVPVVILKAEIPIEVMGYVTGRLADETGLPTVVIAAKNRQAVAEARGPKGFNFVEAFNTMANLFAGYGGHPRAAGFSIASGDVAAFEERFREYVSCHPPKRVPRPVDTELPLSEVTPDVARDLERIRPYGPANGPAILLARSVSGDELDRARAAGLRFGTPLPARGSGVDVVYRVRHSDGVAFANIVDTVDGRAAGG